MTTLDHEALIAHIRACANGTDLLQDGAFQMSARRTIRKALNDAADALSSIPEQGVTWKPITDHTPPDDQYWQMAVDVIERAGNGFHHAVLTNHHAATLLYWANLARDAALAPSQPATVGEWDDPSVQLVYEMICDNVEPPEGEHWEGFLARRVVAALRSAP